MPEANHLGGRYAARRHADGSIDIFDVPIVSELGKGDRADLPKFEITAEWLRAALKRAEARAASGYLPPLHIRHHQEGDVSPRAGFFQPKRVGVIELDGRKVTTLFADLLRIPKAVADKVMSGELPYRSIEILNVNAEPEVDSLALLDSEPPQFRYPLLSIGKLVHQNQATMTPVPVPAATEHASAAVAFAGYPECGSAAALFRFPRTGGIQMADKNNDGKEDKNDDKNNDGKKDKDEKLQAAGDDLAPVGDAAPPWVADMVKQIVDGVTMAISAANKPTDDVDFAAGPTEEEKQAAARKAEADKAMAANAGKPVFLDPTLEDTNEPQVLAATRKLVRATAAQFSGALAETKGEIGGLRAQLAARDKKDAEKAKQEETASLVARAKFQLRAYALDEETLETDLPAQAKLGKEALDRYVAALIRVAPKDPAETFDRFVRDVSPEDTPEVARFQAKGTESLAMARRLEVSWKENRKRGLTKMSLERWLACNEGLLANESAN